jgi:hypothetical protein
MVLCLAGCDLVFELEASPPPCNSDACLTVLASGEVGASEIATEGGDVYWTRPDAVRGCAIADCNPDSFDDPLNPPHGLRIEGDFVLYAGANQMFGVARDGTGVPQAWQDGSGMDVEAFVRLGSAIYWTAGDQGLTRCEYDAGVPACDNATSFNAEGPLATAPLVPDVTGHLWARVGSEIVQIDVSGPDFVRGFVADSPQILATSSTHVFAVVDAQILAWLLTAPDSTDPTLVLETPSPLAVVADAEHLYVLDGGGRIVRVSLLDLQGGEEEILSGVPGLRAMAVTSDRVFIVAGDRIASFPKP